MVFLWTDIFLFSFIVFFCIVGFIAFRQRHWQMAWKQLVVRPVPMFAFVIMMSYLLIGVIDSLHFQTKLGKTYSLLDVVIHPIGTMEESSYSMPFATHTYHLSESFKKPLKQAAYHIKSAEQYYKDILLRLTFALIEAYILIGLVYLVLAYKLKFIYQESFGEMFVRLAKGQTTIAWRSILFALWLVIYCIFLVYQMGGHYYIFGTDKVGISVFYQAVSSIRTGLMIGTLTTLVMLPFAIFLGMTAGFFGGIIDDAIQFFYVTLSSIPGVLLISASVLAFQVIMANNPHWFPSSIERADIRLLGLCVVLGITSWTSLCRLLRAETLKVREYDYLEAAKALGVKSGAMMLRHILPNIFHIIIITVVLDFSMLVLAETVLSYIGVGVDPSMMSWGQMINSARLELAREPIVWWPLLSAFLFMSVFVLSINVFADAVRDALDPKIRKLV